MTEPETFDVVCPDCKRRLSIPAPDVGDSWPIMPRHDRDPRRERRGRRPAGLDCVGSGRRVLPAWIVGKLPTPK